MVCHRPPPAFKVAQLARIRLGEIRDSVSNGQLAYHLWQLRRPDCLGLAYAVTNADAREVKPSGVDAHEQGRALSIMDTTPALAEGIGPPASSSLTGLRKPPLQSSRQWSPRYVARQRIGTKRHRKARPGMKSICCRERANAKSIRHRKGARMRESTGVSAGRCDRAAGSLRRRNEWTRQRGSCLKSTVHAKVKSVIRHWYQHQKQPRTFTHTFAIPSRHRAAVPFSF